MSNPDWQQLLRQGIQRVQAKQGPAALADLQQARQLQPGSRDVLHWLGQALRLCGEETTAESTFRRLLDTNPLDSETALALAFLLREQGRMEELCKVLLHLAEQPSVTTLTLLQLAGVLRDSNQFDSAIMVMKTVLKRESGQANRITEESAINYFRLGRLYQGVGQHEPALQAYRYALQGNPDLGGAWLGLATLQRFTNPDQPDWQLLLSAPAFSNPETAMCLAFARAKGFDDLQQYEQAWNQYCEGNRLRALDQPWDRPGWRSLFNQAMKSPLPNQAALPSPRRPVFIVGMLRSGTTLLEQLLDQHPRVTARGELNLLAHAWRPWQQNPHSMSVAEDLATQIWTHMRQDGPEDGFYIDKNPLNFRYLSLLATCMPEARILHLQRDGRDSCLSCFMQLFQHQDSSFSSRLDDLVHFYHDYLQLMQRYEQMMPGQIFSLAYEDLINDSTAALKAALEFLGLQEIDSDLSRVAAPASQRPIRTASSWQARQDIHQRSMGRWQHYQEFAPEFFDRIAELDQHFRPATDPSI